MTTNQSKGILDRLGEVTASPTANTVLDRLKSIATNAGAPALAAGEAHLGAVGGWSEIITVVPTVNTSIYVAGNCVGGLLTLTNALRGSPNTRFTGIWQSVFVVDTSNQKAALDILLFTSLPAGTFTDHAAFPTLTRADGQLVRRRVSIAATDYVTVGGTAFAEISSIGKVVKGAAATLYAACNTPGTPTYANAADLQLGFGFLAD